MNIELTTSPSAEDAKTISRALLNYNYKAAKDLEPESAYITFSIFARDEKGTINGGLRATCFWNTLHIELCWVSEEIRMQGIGSKMVKKAEAFAAEKGFEQALLETTDWQAEPFYKKLGYKIIATIPQYPKGHVMHFMTKTLEF